MKKTVFIFLVLTAVLTAMAQEPVPVHKSYVTEIDSTGKQFYIHPVQKGQTLYSISKIYDVSYEEIFRYNPFAKEGLKVGDILRIPVNPETQSSGYNAVQDTAVVIAAYEDTEEDEYILHYVRPKETFFGLSKKYNISVKKLKEVNPSLGDYPKAGEIIKIPKLHLDRPEPAIEIAIHKVQPKETLYAISRKYKISVENIVRFNPWLSERELQAGELIKIPLELPPAAKTESSTSTDTVKSKNYLEHKVQTGETLYSIARKYGVSIEGLKKFDSTLTDNIQLGQIIKIPLIKPSANYIIHKTEEKTKLKTLAKKYNVSYEKLKQLNPDIRRKVRKNETVKIPINKEELINILKEEEKIDSVAYLPVKDTAHIDRCIERLEEDRRDPIKVALLLPLFLDKTDIESWKKPLKPEDIKRIKAFRFLPFYEAFLLAADSITRKGEKVEIFVYDIDNSPAKTIHLLNNMDMLDMDLIVGPLFRKPFIQFSNFAKLQGINIINPLSKRNSIIKNNDRVFKLKPDKNERKFLLSSTIQQLFPKENILIVHQNNTLEYKPDLQYLKAYFYFQRQFPDGGSFYKVLKNPVHDSLLQKHNIHIANQKSAYPAIAGKLSTDKENVVIILGEDKTFLKEIMGKLKKFKSENKDAGIHLFTYADPEKTEEISIRTFMDMDTRYLSDHYVDYERKDVQNFIRKCRTQFGFEPLKSNYAFEAYDLGLFFLDAVRLYGKDFQHCVSYVPQRNLANAYHFEKNGRHGYNNIHWNVLHLTGKGVEKINE